MTKDEYPNIEALADGRIELGVTTRTAAEALVRDCANRLDQLFRQDYTMREVEAELRRLLRATQSNGRSSGSCSNGNAGDGPGQPVAGESPAQQAQFTSTIGESGPRLMGQSNDVASAGNIARRPPNARGS